MYRLSHFALFILPVLCVGCVDGGIKVGPFPVAFAIGDGEIDPEMLDTERGQFGVQTVFIPICNLPTRDEVDATVEASLTGSVASLFELSELLVDEFVLTANEGSFAGITSVSAFFLPPGSKNLLTAVPLGTSASIKEMGAEIVLRPPHTVDVLDLIAESGGEECPDIAFVVTGLSPSARIVWQGDLFAEAYGVVDVGL